MKKSSQWILYGFLLLVASILSYIWSPVQNTVLYPSLLPIASIGLWILLIGILEKIELYNKFIYFTTTAVIIILILILIYNQASDTSTNIKIFSYVIGAILTLFTILRTYTITKEWKYLTEYNEALKLNHEDTTALNNKGTVLAGQKLYNDALECFEKVLEIDPEDAAAHHNKGVILSKLGNHREAVEYYDKALEIDPKLEKAKKEGKIILEN